MGIFTQNIQQLERSLTNEQKKRSYKKEKIRELELYLYNKFYNKFYNNKLNNPDFTLGYFMNPDIKKRILKYDGFLDDIEKNKTYNNILHNIYKDFKKYYILEIDTKKEEQEEQKEIKQYKKALAKNQKLKQQQQETRRKIINNILGSFAIGLLIPTRKRKSKYKI